MLCFVDTLAEGYQYMLNREVIAAFAREQFRTAEIKELKLIPLRGGLESCGIARTVVINGDNRQAGTFVVKSLNGGGMRELEMHSAVERTSQFQIAPRLLGARACGSCDTYLFLEWVGGGSRWPWRTSGLAGLVLDQLARVHSWNPQPFRPALAGWNYETELQASAESTLDMYREAFMAGTRPGDRAMIRAMERVALALPEIRRQLASVSGTTLVHGDAHPGNAIIRQTGDSECALLLDWGRARLGSPLEDVYSWVQSLGFWEPEAKRKHDALLRRYLIARGHDPLLTSEFRAACYLAGASNAMAGALRYHMAVISDPARPSREQWNSWRAAADWLRVVRRADALWRSHA